jgi:hypothetical protein
MGTMREWLSVAFLSLFGGRGMVRGPVARWNNATSKGRNSK